VSNLAKRLLSAGVLLPIVIAAFILGGWVLRALILLAAIIALWEYGTIVCRDDRRSRGALLVVGGIATFLSLLVTDAVQGALVMQLAMIVLASTFVLAPGRGGPFETSWQRLTMLTFGVLYVGLGLSSVSHLREMGASFKGVGQGGFILVAFTATWANDTCAYFAGRAFGKHRMSEAISPKKTWEGFVGGLLGALAFLVGGRFLFPDVFAGMTYLDMVLVGIPASFLGPMGDLAESMLKRNFGVKDSGTVLPGHGGILDRIDAVLFVAPWTLAYFAGIKPLVDRLVP
jgi:phosphatidate cytidylyltransferase